jgi:hypothetical protein
MSDAYAAPAAATGDLAASSDDQDTKPYLDIDDLVDQHESYHDSKSDEINEKGTARSYYSGSQWTSDELRKLKARNQPPITRNRIKRKINGVVGLVERMRQDPKAYPRTPNDDGSADIATAVIRYALDNNRWESLSSKVASDVAKEGLGGLELGLAPSIGGDYDITLARVPTDAYFYDPVSFEADFSDVLFHGTAKWVDMEIAKTFCPQDRWDEISSATSSEGTQDDEKRSVRWYDSQRKRVRLVDHWYYRNGVWCWALHTKSLVLMEGLTPFYDPDNKPISKFIMFSANVDQDGDRYGFFRDMKDIQDETNHRYSKALHLLNTRRIIARKGSFSDINKVRTEANKTDGIIEWETEKPEFDDAKSLADMQGQLRFLEDAKAEIENFGPNPALMGMAEGAKSGRAIALLQQAGIAELGTYIIEYKDWKLRVYRAVFCAAKKHWTMERWIRVVDPEDEMQMLQINGLRSDPVTGVPQTVNSMAQIDVDIIIDEGSDTVNAMQDAFDALGVLASRGAEVPPGLLIELAPINSRIKKKWLKQMEEAQSSDPMKEQAKRIALESEDAKVMETKSKAIKNMTDAMKNVAEGAYSPATIPYEPHLLGLADLLDSDETNNGGVAMPPAGTGAGPTGGMPLQGAPPPRPEEQLAGGQFPAAPANQPMTGG